MSADICQEIQLAIAAAYAEASALKIVGGNSKAFLGHEPAGQSLNISDHRGVINYEPTELVITARAGTPLADIETTLAEKEQMLGFEPPHFGPATLGGTIACGLSGPRRAYAGAARDFTLGTRIISGRGEIMRFGGEVMKNVAGYDVSRLMVGAMGTLGVLLDISLKVLPKPEEELTVAIACDTTNAIRLMNEWATKPIAISATAFDGAQLYVRLSGSYSAIRAAFKYVGNHILEEGEIFWESVREHTHSFFPLRSKAMNDASMDIAAPGGEDSFYDLPPDADFVALDTNKQSTPLSQDETLWRISVPSATPALAISGNWFFEWGGALRWLRSTAPAAEVRVAVTAARGHATIFYGNENKGHVFHPLPDGVAAIHRNLKNAFDPKRILNPGRMYTYI